MSPRVVLLETGYKLVELVQSPQVSAQQRSKIYGDVIHRITSGLIRVYKRERARAELEVNSPNRNGRSYRKQIVDLSQSRSWGTGYQLRPTYTSTLFVIPDRENNSVRERDIKNTISWEKDKN